MLFIPNCYFHPYLRAVLYGIAAASAALLLTAVLAALLRLPALRAGVVDRRRSRPLPLLGGLAVVTVTSLVAWTGEWTRVAPLGDGVGGLLLAAVAVGLLGLVADVWRLRGRVIAAGTAVAAACVVPYDETGVAGARSPWPGSSSSRSSSGGSTTRTVLPGPWGWSPPSGPVSAPPSR